MSTPEKHVFTSAESAQTKNQQCLQNSLSPGSGKLRPSNSKIPNLFWTFCLPANPFLYFDNHPWPQNDNTGVRQTNREKERISGRTGTPFTFNPRQSSPFLSSTACEPNATQGDYWFLVKRRGGWEWVDACEYFLSGYLILYPVKYLNSLKSGEKLHMLNSLEQKTQR
jgi:hypothetical protein